MLEERLKELETAKNYLEVLNLLKKYESDLSKAYTHISSVIANPIIIGILKALEEMSISATSLLRYCITLLEENEIPETSITGEPEFSSSVPIPTEKTRDRDNIFSLNSLNELMEELPKKEILKDDDIVSMKFWYIKSAQNESIEIEMIGKEIFGRALQEALKKIESSPDEKFSISPLGYEVLLQHQFTNSITQIINHYGIEFTLIKMYS